MLNKELASLPSLNRRRLVQGMAAALPLAHRNFGVGNCQLGGVDFGGGELLRLRPTWQTGQRQGSDHALHQPAAVERREGCDFFV